MCLAVSTFTEHLLQLLRALGNAVVVGGADDLQGGQRGSEAPVQRLGTRSGDDLILLGGNEQGGGSHVGRVTPGFELIDEQPPHGEEGELVCGEVKQAVIGTDENEAFSRTDAREMNGDAAAQAAADHDDVRMVGMHAIE